VANKADSFVQQMDKGIICDIKADKQSAFNDTYFRYHHQIYSFVFKKTQSAHIATEVVQLCFIRLWESRKSLKEDLELNIQLFGMAHQVMIDELRRESTRIKYNRASSDQPWVKDQQLRSNLNGSRTP
jgi:DNA-directed RNA polymerase specialized sigma24 family protein